VYNICYCRQFWWNNNKIRVGCVDFAIEIKRTERNKQFVMSESTKVTEKRKRDSTIIHWRPQKLFQGGNVGSLFIIFKLLTISVPSKIILHWANICFIEHDVLGLSKWSFQWITIFVNCIKYIQSYQNTNKIHISFKNSMLLVEFPFLWNVANTREQDFTAQQFWWSWWVFAHLTGNIASGDSRIKKVGGGTAGPRNKVGGQHKCLSCMVIFRCFEN